MPEPNAPDPESVRLVEDRDHKANWKRWGPYLSERQWGTVRFHGDIGAGIGASHQTGWTGLVAKLLQQSGE